MNTIYAILPLSHVWGIMSSNSILNRSTGAHLCAYVLVKVLSWEHQLGTVTTTVDLMSLCKAVFL